MNGRDWVNSDLMSGLGRGGGHICVARAVDGRDILLGCAHDLERDVHDLVAGNLELGDWRGFGIETLQAGCRDPHKKAINIVEDDKLD